MMTLWEASKKRISVRAYQDRPVEEETLDRIRAYIDELNGVSGLPFQLVTGPGPGVPAVKLPGAMFSGSVYAFAALVGGSDNLSAEKVGYYGQDLVLFLTRLGLGTCWVAGTYDRKSFSLDLPEGMQLWGILLIGWAAEKMPVRQQMIRAAIRRKDRKLKDFLESDLTYDQVPAWVRKGIEAVKDGPSAVNQQPANIVYDRGKVWARLWKEGRGLQFNDLGIAKRQFEVGAAEAGMPGRFAFGDGGHFSPEAEA